MIITLEVQAVYLRIAKINKQKIAGLLAVLRYNKLTITDK
jgi:hypothetical protein